MSVTPQVTVFANLQNLTGGVSSNGTMRLSLKGYGDDIPVVPGAYVIDNFHVAQVAGNGTAVMEVFGNDVIFPSGTFYQVEILSPGGTPVFLKNYIFSGANTYDLSVTTPFTPTTVTISPSAVTLRSSATLQSTESQQFTVASTGFLSIPAVFWEVDGILGGDNTVGTITNLGLYTAPLQADSNQSHTVTVTLTSGSLSNIATATVQVTQAISVVVSPATATIAQLAAQQFTAVLSPVGTDQSVLWAVNGIQGGNSTVGTITNDGLYLAPSTDGSYTINATSARDLSESNSATITVSGSSVSVLVSPNSVSVDAVTGTALFSAIVTGTSDPSITWTATGGTFSSTTDNPTIWTAPALAGSYSVTATSVADPSQSSTANINVHVRVQFGPTNVSLPINATQAFTATVIGSADQSVTWSLIGVGSLTSTSTNPTTYTAPNTAGSATLQVVAGVDPSRSAQTSITVTSADAIIIAAYALNQVTTIGTTLAYQALVYQGSTLAANQSIQWKVAGILGGNSTVGTISPATTTTTNEEVTYTPPATPTKQTITAFSSAYSLTATTQVIVVGTNVQTTVTPGAPNVLIGTSQQFTASVSEVPDPTSVTWSLLPHGAGGSISSTGLYQAPASIPTVTAFDTINANPTDCPNLGVSGNASAIIVQPIATVCPGSSATLGCSSSVTVLIDATQQFSVLVTNTSNQNVHWFVDSVQGGNSTSGTISSTGLYTAPHNPGTHTISALSVLGGRSNACSAVVQGLGVAVTINPTSANTVESGTLSFSATVTGSSNTAVTWSVTAGTAIAGSITINGLYTAPAAAGTNTVTATSVADPSKSASASVVISVPATVTIAVTAAAGSIGVNKSTVITANVTNGTSGATFTATGGTFGTATTTVNGSDSTSSVTYTAPAAAGSYIITATAANSPHPTASTTVVATAVSVPIIPKEYFGNHMLGITNTIGGFTTSFPTVAALYTNRAFTHGTNFCVSNYSAFQAALDAEVIYYRGGTGAGKDGASYQTSNVLVLIDEGAFAAHSTSNVWNSSWLTGSWVPFINNFVAKYGVGGSAPATDVFGAVEIWNEPDLQQNISGTTAQQIAAWNALVLADTGGGVSVYQKLHNAGFLVCGPCPQTIQQGWLDTWASTAQAAGKPVVDVITRHHYRNTPEIIGTTIAADLTTLEKYAMFKSTSGLPYWVTEANINNFVSDLNETIGIAFMQRAVITSWIQGSINGVQRLQRFFWYAYDTSGTVSSSGIAIRMNIGGVDATNYPSNTTAGETVVAKAWGGLKGSDGTLLTASGTTSKGFKYTTLQPALIGSQLTNLTTVGTAVSCNITYASGATGKITWDNSDFSSTSGALGTTAQKNIPSFGTTNTKSSNHVYLITEENTSAYATDPGARCGVSGFPACNSGFTSSTYRRYMIGNSTDMPYLQTLVAKGTQASNVYSNIHSSWFAWVLLTAGVLLPSNQGSNERCMNIDNLVRRIRALGKTWKAYSEGLPSAGFQGDNTTLSTTCAGTSTARYFTDCGYKRGHNPLINFTDTSAGTGGLPGHDPITGIACPNSGQQNQSVPMGQFFSDMTNNKLPNFSYITPTLGNDMHDGCAGCSPFLYGNGTGTLANADSWLKGVLDGTTGLLARPEFQPGGDGVLIIMTDEGNIQGGGSPLSVATDSLCNPGTTTCPAGVQNAGGSGGGHCCFIAVGPNIKQGAVVSTTYHFEDILQTISTLLGFGGSSAPGAGANGVVMDIFK